jgi:hypothetical protein
MFFVVVFNVLNAMFRVAEEAGFFSSLAAHGIKHRLSFFADDVVLLIRPSIREASSAMELLKLFGEASGLRCNLAKSSISPIRCEEVDLQPILDVLGCPVQNFPIKYLGPPLSVSRLSKSDLQPLVDKVARTVPAWTAALMKKSGRLVYINAKLAASPIYHMLSLDLPPWFFSTVNKLLRGFFWSATSKARRGHCVVAWDSVCTPKDLGGLGLKNLKILNYALRMRWRWLALTEEDKPWGGLKFRISTEAEDMFQTCIKFEIGNGAKTRFWTDRWLDGRSIEQMAPNLMALIRPGARELSVATAQTNDRWVSEIRGTPSIPAIAEYLVKEHFPPFWVLCV